MSKPRVSSALFRAMLALTLLNGLGFIWAYRFIPLADYPDWMYQGLLFSRVIRGEILQHYALKSYPVPYSIMTLTLGLLDLLLRPEVSGKIALTAGILFFAGSSVYLLKSLNPSERSPLLYIPLLFVFSAWFFAGELCYVIGLGFLFIFCGYLFRRLGDAGSISGWFVLLTSAGMFFSHAMPYLTAGLIGAVFFLSRPSMRLFSKFAAGFAPTIATLVWYVAGGSSKGNAGWVFWTPHLLAGTFLKAFSPFQEFLPWLSISVPGMKAVALLDLLVSAGVAALWVICAMVWWNGRRSATPVLAAAGACLIGFVAVGYGLSDLSFGGRPLVGERLLYPAAWLAWCWLSAQWRPGEYQGLAKAARAGVCALLVVQALYLDLYVGIAARGLQDLYVRLREAQSQPQFCSIYQDYFARSSDRAHRTGLNRLLSNAGTVVRLPYYMYIEDGATAPIQQIGIFNYDGPGNSEDLCK